MIQLNYNYNFIHSLLNLIHSLLYLIHKYIYAYTNLLQIIQFNIILIKT